MAAINIRFVTPYLLQGLRYILYLPLLNCYYTLHPVLLYSHLQLFQCIDIVSMVYTSKNIVNANNQLICNNVKVADMIDQGVWKWPSNWEYDVPDINNIVVLVLNSERKDMVMWKTSDNVLTKFSVNNVWIELRLNKERVISNRTVWHNHCIPSHAFILWLAILGRLSTQDMLARWYPGREDKCALCEDCPDSHEHLFFKCSYAGIWKEIKKLIWKESCNDEWKDTIHMQ